MSIKLDWSGGSTDIDGYKVYRSETPINPQNPGLPIVTLGKEVKTWTDENTPRGKLFYYRVSSYKGSESAITFERAMAYVPYTGPGPAELAIGDWEAGYFGEIPVNDLIQINKLKKTLGLVLTNGKIVDKSSNWLKMVYQGKILYMPDNCIGEGYWSNYYTAGLVYGDLNPALIPQAIKTALGEKPQNKRIVIGEDEFIFRLPKSRKDVTSTSTATNDLGGNEWDMVYSKLFAARSLTNFDPVKGFRSFARTDNADRLVMTSDHHSATNAIITRQVTYGDTTSTDYMAVGTTDGSVLGVIPVLELVL